MSPFPTSLAPSSYSDLHGEPGEHKSYQVTLCLKPSMLLRTPRANPAPSPRLFPFLVLPPHLSAPVPFFSPSDIPQGICTCCLCSLDHAAPHSSGNQLLQVSAEMSAPDSPELVPLVILRCCLLYRACLAPSGGGAVRVTFPQRVTFLS